MLRRNVPISFRAPVILLSLPSLLARPAPAGRPARPTGPDAGFGSLGGAPRRPAGGHGASPKTTEDREGSIMAEEVLRERQGHVEVLTINRPEARNAINGAVSMAMSGFLDELAEDPDCSVVVITGSGDKAFSAGMDLKAFSSGEGGSIMGASGGFGGITQRAFPKPIIAAVNGSALAGGFEIMLSCDLVVAAEHATFGIPEAKRGLIAGAGGLIRMPKRLPIAIALELAMTGDSISAPRAFELGLVNRVVPAGVVLEEAISLADRIAANAPLAVRYSKSVMKQAAEVSEAEGWKLNAEAVGVVFSSADAMEGPIAFAEKRPPNWQGK
jgi:enoyl-CoA hydratase